MAAFDPATGQWARLDAPQGVLLSVVALPGGQLLLGGDFQDPVGTGSVLQIWTGSSWSAAIPQPSGLAVLGLGTLSLPLPSLLPQGVAGCQLLVTPDVLGLVLPSGGVAQVPLPLPLVPSLVGGVLHLQVAPIEFGVGGAITAVTSTNRLSLTLGVF